MDSITIGEARQILSDREAADLIREHKIQLSMDDPRHPTVYMAEVLLCLQNEDEGVLS